jgi:ubiquinol-cytochrome c reductase cytochrome b subunit
MGYVLPFGQMSFWGATVITNLLSPFPNVVEYLSGGFSISNSTTKRFFIFHFILPFFVLAIVVIHLFYLHFLSSSNPIRYSTNNKIPFFPYLILKDVFSLFLVIALYFFQCTFGLFVLSHPDNSLEANPLVTPLHIVPEWYFLIQYAMLKAIPNKNSGFIILITSITVFILLIENRNFTTLTCISFQSIFINYILKHSN